jgi:type II secretory pathway component PulJ
MRRTHGKTRAAGTARGFTLVEALVGGTLMTLLLLGTMTLFTESSRSTQRTTVAVQATQDGTYGLQ